MASPDWVGIGVGAAIGVFGIYLALRRAKYPGRLVFIARQSIALLNSSATRLPNLTLTYKDAPIGKSVVLISGYVANEGSIDLTPSEIEVPLTCELPDGCSWLEFRVTSASPQLKVTAVEQGPAVIALQFGQFRRDESFAFQALAQLDEAHSRVHGSVLATLLTWRHRIAGVADVRQTEIEPLDQSSRSWKVTRIAIYLLAAAFLTTMALDKLGMVPFLAQPVIAYEYTSDGTTAIYEVRHPRFGTDKLIRVDDGETKEVDLKELLRTNALKPVLSAPRVGVQAISVSVFFLLAALAAVLRAFLKDRKLKRLHKLVATSPASVETL